MILSSIKFKIPDDSDDGGIQPMDISEEDDSPTQKFIDMNSPTHKFIDMNSPTQKFIDMNSSIHSNIINEPDFLDEINKHVGDKPDMIADIHDEYEDGLGFTSIDPPEVIRQRRFVKAKRRGNQNNVGFYF